MLYWLITSKGRLYLTITASRMLNKFLCANVDLGLFLVRLALALVFVVHGLQKFQNLEMTVGFFGTLGVPAFLAYLVSAIELLGGIAMLFGVLTEWAGWLLAAVMVGAISLVKSSMGFSGGYEFDLTLLLSALAIAVSGPGRYTARALLAPKAERPNA